MDELKFPIYLLEDESLDNRYYTTTEEKAIELHDKLTTELNKRTNDNYFLFSKWAEQDPEGYSPNVPIEDFAECGVGGVNVDKITSLPQLLELLCYEKY